MAATTRTVTGIIYKPDGTLWTSQTVTFDLLTPIAVATDGNVIATSVTATTDASTAAFSVDLAVPASGAYDWQVKFPNNQMEHFTLADGDATTLHAIMASQETTQTADGILTLIDGKLDAADYTAADVLSKLLTVDGSGTGLDADKLDGSHASAFEAALGNPDADGYVLSSTTGGTRSWVAQSAGASDVDDLTTTSGSSTDMLRVAAAGGLEYRTTAQVLADIGAAPTASPTFTGTVTLPATVASIIKPASDSTTALQLANAAGTAVVTVDTVTPKITLGTARLYAYDLIAMSNSSYSSQTAMQLLGNKLTIGGGASIASVELQKPLSSSIITSETSTTVLLSTLAAQSTGTAAAGFGGYIRFRGSANPTGVYTSGAIGGKWVDASTSGYSGAIALYVTDGGSETLNERLVATIVGISIGHGATPTASADIAASTTAAASLCIRSGTAPTSPNDGDIWYDGTNLKFYDGTTTRTISWT